MEQKLIFHFKRLLVYGFISPNDLPLVSMGKRIHDMEANTPTATYTDTAAVKEAFINT